MKVILLLGSSSAGKSTLCRGVVEATKEKPPQWIVRDTDTFYRYCVTQAVDAFSKSNHIQGLLSELVMSPDKIVHFAGTGILQTGISNDDNEPSTPHLFRDLELTGVERVLKELKIEDYRIPFLADELRNLITHRAELEALLPKPNQAFLNDFFENIFSETLEPNDTLVIDINPQPGVGPAMISELMDQHIQRYGEKQEQSMESFKVLAYCPLEVLSERMHKRSQHKKDDEYMGDGVFPFQQVAMLVSPYRTEEKSESTQNHTKWDTIGELSRKSVFDLANKHTEHNNNEPLVIVDTVDPTALQSPEVEALDSSVSEIPVVAPKSVVEAYHDLTDKFGFYANETQIKLGVTTDFQCDVIIDTSKQDASDLIDEINQLSKTSTYKPI